LGQLKEDQVPMKANKCVGGDQVIEPQEVVDDEMSGWNPVDVECNSCGDCDVLVKEEGVDVKVNAWAN
jgi:hypothetical protein